ncbi:hypothetical protein [Vibrio cholerae]|uniref:hypothetical protein n=2 Tax=Vibrio cholerae TaxID=666 RepID=UPI0020B6A7C4|nr:hypothetical protein [Vibrio cholerae]
MLSQIADFAAMRVRLTAHFLKVKVMQLNVYQYNQFHLNNKGWLMNTWGKKILAAISVLLLIAGCGSESDQDKLTKELKLVANYSQNIDKNYNRAMGLMKDVSSGLLTLSDAGSAMASSADSMDSFIVMLAKASTETSKEFENNKVQDEFAKATENLWKGYKLKYNFVTDVSKALSSQDITQMNSVIKRHDGFGNRSQVLMFQAMSGYMTAKQELGMETSLDEFK